MAQEIHTCLRCGRERYESRLQKVRAHGVSFWVCLAKGCKRYGGKK